MCRLRYRDAEPHRHEIRGMDGCGSVRRVGPGKISAMEALELMRQIVYGYDPATTDFKEFLRLLNSNNGEQWPR